MISQRELRQHTIWPISPENCMKMKKIAPRRGGRPLRPLRSTTGHPASVYYLSINYWIYHCDKQIQCFFPVFLIKVWKGYRIFTDRRRFIPILRWSTKIQPLMSITSRFNSQCPFALFVLQLQTVFFLFFVTDSSNSTETWLRTI